MENEKNVDLNEKETVETEVKETEVKEPTLEETKNEETNEEIKEETVDPNNTKEETPYFDLEKANFDDCEAYVKSLKQDFDKEMNKGRKWQMIIMIVLIIGLIGTFIGSGYLPKDLGWITYVLMGGFIIGMVIYLIIISKGRKSLDVKVQEFLKNFIYGLDAYAFASNEKLSEVKANKQAKVTIDEIVDAHYFDVINDFNTRNVVKAQLLERELRCGELACRVPTPVKLDENGNVIPLGPKEPTETFGIFGKYFSYELCSTKEQAFIIYMEGKNAYKPTFLDGYEEITVEDLRSDFHCYVVDKEQGLAQINNIKYLLNEYVSDDVLENLFVSYNEKGLRICLNYNESLMEVPLRNPVKNKPYLHFKEDVDGVVGICECLANNVCLKVEHPRVVEAKEETKEPEVKEAEVKEEVKEASEEETKKDEE